MRRTWGTALALTLTLAAAACGGTDEEPDGPGREAGADFSVTSSLAQLPALDSDAHGANISVADVAAVRAANGLEVPDPADEDAVGDYAIAMTGNDPDAVAMLNPGAISRSSNINDERGRFGFSWLESDRMATVSAPPEEFTWAAYDEPVELAEDLTDTGDGTWSTGSDEDGDLLGRPVQVATDGSEAVTSLSTDSVTDWLAGDAETLADDEPLGAVAGALDDHDVISAYLIRFGGDDGTQSVGVGWTVDDGEPGFVIAYDAGDEDAASAALDRLRADYAEPKVTEHLDVSDVTAQGRTVVVTAIPVEGRVSILLQLLLNFGLPTLP
ncbi:hypothetical protein [Nocardioides sp. 503]|uniref:hypothetical protein n=1 Tax=Nocardioides sp. 503 TaxID=2508326 RepID=UPI00106F4D9F|nr:hypothetical protein [Nocardioides sp. 503]